MVESKTPSHKELCCKELSHEEPVHQTLGSKKEIRSQIRALRAELVKPEHAAEKAAMDEKIREAVLQLLHTLKAQYSGTVKFGIEAIEWKVKGLTGKEIADMYGVKPNLVGAWISRAASRLKQNSVFLQAFADRVEKQPQ